MAELRFLSDRGLGLLRRGLASLRTRGMRASWRRLALQLFPPARAPGTAALYAPPAGIGAPAAVPASDAPRASIVIPVHGQLAHTLACLQALAAHPPATACEVIVVDDCSPDETASVLAAIDGLRLHRRASNGGFIAACNDGAALARGETLVFLNNDTVPQPGWLDALLDTFQAHPRAGLVGAQLLYPDGRLQEAGGVVFADGSAWNLGRFESPDDPRFAYVRDADYVSGAAIAIPRGLFEAIGGFDDRYAPAYYEDTDLAFKVRASGHRVLYQPASRVVHVEGVTSGTDTSSGTKAYQVRNQVLFTERWATELMLHPARAEPTAASVSGSRPQVLLIDALTAATDAISITTLRGKVDVANDATTKGAAVASVQSNARSLSIDAVDELYDFILDRLRGYYEDRGVPPQHFAAVAALKPASLYDFDRRIDAIGSFAALPEAEALAAADKRIRNILRKADIDVPAQVDPGLFTEPAERALAEAVEAVYGETTQALADGDYVDALARLARLRPQVDAFFDAVMVNADDMAVRANRLALLKRLGGRLGSVAAIEQLSG